MDALPDKDDPIDPTKRAPVSTAEAVKPAAKPDASGGVVRGRIIRMSEIPIRRSTLGDQRSSVQVKETRSKDRVIRPSARELAVRKFDSHHASDRPAMIPRISAERFQRMLREYEENRVPATSWMGAEIELGDQRVGLAEINRFASPRAALEAQGIPVTTAGSGEATPSAAPTVPISEAQNGGGSTNSPRRP